jgi:mono/diheme cytochrome c family protein
MSQGFNVVAALFLAASLAAPAFAETPGAVIYNTASPKCGMCHGADGLAATQVGKAMKVLSFKAPEMMSAPDAQFIASTKNGKGKMPAYKGKLTDAQIKDVVAYIRTLQK